MQIIDPRNSSFTSQANLVSQAFCSDAGMTNMVVEVALKKLGPDFMCWTASDTVHEMIARARMLDTRYGPLLYLVDAVVRFLDSQDPGRSYYAWLESLVTETRHHEMTVELVQMVRRVTSHRCHQNPGFVFSDPVESCLADIKIAAEVLMNWLIASQMPG